MRSRPCRIRRTSTRGIFPAFAILKREWRTVRDEALALRDERRTKAAGEYDDIGFNSFFRNGWKRFYLNGMRPMKYRWARAVSGAHSSRRARELDRNRAAAQPDRDAHQPDQRARQQRERGRQIAAADVEQQHDPHCVALVPDLVLERVVP